MKAKPTPITKKTLKPKIIIFIEVEIVDGVKGSLYSVIVRLVGMIKFSLLATTSQFYGVDELFIRMCTCLFQSPSFVALEAVLLYHPRNTSLLLHFVITVTILAVVLCILIPLIRAKSNCRFATVYTG